MTETKNIPSNGETPVDEPVAIADFGLQLRQAREAAGYSIADVSDQLKLTAELIEALESSRLEELPASTFTQGYLRNYARLLKLPADEIVQAYNRQVPSVEPDLMPTSGVPAQKNSHDAIVKITSYGLSVIGLLLFVLWWQQTDFQLLSGTGESEPAAENTEITTDDENSEFPAPFIRQSITEQDSLGDTARDSMAQAEQDVQPSEPLEVEISQVNTPAQEVKAEPETKPAAAIETVSSSKPETVTAPSGDDVMLISTTSESWTEVQDADENRLFFKLMKRGQDYTIKGRAPFKIFLGNAPSVEIRMNRQNVDISAYIRKNNIANLVIKADATIASPKIVRAPEASSQPTSDDASRDLMFDEGR